MARELVQRYDALSKVRERKGTYERELASYDMWLDILAPRL